MTQTQIAADAIMLTTRIPEGRSVAGLTYGAHVSGQGWSGYYVEISGVWGVARQTPADDELEDDDRAICEAIADELRSAS